VTIDLGPDRFTAELLVAKLHDAGIPTSDVMGDALQQAPNLALVQGLQVSLREEDLERARAVLRDGERR
jgi:hypothetical protein